MPMARSSTCKTHFHWAYQHFHSSLSFPGYHRWYHLCLDISLHHVSLRSRHRQLSTEFFLLAHSEFFYWNSTDQMLSEYQTMVNCTFRYNRHTGQRLRSMFGHNCHAQDRPLAETIDTASLRHHRTEPRPMYHSNNTRVDIHLFDTADCQDHCPSGYVFRVRIGLEKSREQTLGKGGNALLLSDVFFHWLQCFIYLSDSLSCIGH